MEGSNSNSLDWKHIDHLLFCGFTHDCILAYFYYCKFVNLHIYSFSYTIAQLLTKPQEVHWFASELWGASHHICRNCPSDRLIICPNVRFDGNQSWRDSPKWGRLFEVEGPINHHHHHHQTEQRQSMESMATEMIPGQGWSKGGFL